jgi:hypothetical protein
MFWPVRSTLADGHLGELGDRFARLSRRYQAARIGYLPRLSAVPSIQHSNLIFDVVVPVEKCCDLSVLQRSVVVAAG